ncbi:hypothetical protein [Azomonas macrocytogenes]|uniref:Uncharacterized protein n=1 Tax=Azomonas macrocytogenes TaxID=69962 RepID=A0A839T139_AZOMA|nr:hypothetical protein [Azomonas macrocytogenes]MBB3102114.1 hypothetical protein [Azomonas macrocytogenes]
MKGPLRFLHPVKRNLPLVFHSRYGGFHLPHRLLLSCKYSRKPERCEEHHGLPLARSCSRCNNFLARH